MTFEDVFFYFLSMSNISRTCQTNKPFCVCVPRVILILRTSSLFKTSTTMSKPAELPLGNYSETGPATPLKSSLIDINFPRAEFTLSNGQRASNQTAINFLIGLRGITSSNVNQLAIANARPLHWSDIRGVESVSRVTRSPRPSF